MGPSATGGLRAQPGQSELPLVGRFSNSCMYRFIIGRVNEGGATVNGQRAIRARRGTLRGIGASQLLWTPAPAFDPSPRRETSPPRARCRASLSTSRTWRNAVNLKSFATVALVLIPGLAFAAGGGGTGISNGGNGGPGGANSDASNGNTPPGPANAYFGTDNTMPATMGASKEMKRHNREPQKAL